MALPSPKGFARHATGRDAQGLRATGSRPVVPLNSLPPAGASRLTTSRADVTGDGEGDVGHRATRTSASSRPDRGRRVIG